MHLVSAYLFHPWLLLSLCPTVLRNLCLSHGPKEAPASPGVKTSLQAAEKGRWMSTALSVTFLKEHCPHCLQWLMCFPPIGQTGHMTILDAREMGKNLLMLVAQMVKRLLTMQETWVRSLGQELQNWGPFLNQHRFLGAWAPPHCGHLGPDHH